MPDSLTLDMNERLRPTPSRPLAGMTILMVEDSRYASEAVRLMSLRSGARLRRADCLAAADRHLRVYRPTVMIVDLGLPDGSGLELIDDLSRSDPRIPAILATSGDAEALERARLIGADGVLPKPLESLGTFQTAVLSALPDEMRPTGPRAVPSETVAPDDMALMDDYARVAEIIAGPESDRGMDYVAQFLGGLGHAVQDAVLSDAAERLRCHHEGGQPVLGDMAQIAGLLQDRMARRTAV